jgi:hypothetical protein
MSIAVWVDGTFEAGAIEKARRRFPALDVERIATDIAGRIKADGSARPRRRRTARRPPGWCLVSGARSRWTMPGARRQRRCSCWWRSRRHRTRWTSRSSSKHSLSIAARQALLPCVARARTSSQASLAGPKWRRVGRHSRARAIRATRGCYERPRGPQARRFSRAREPP